MSFHKIALSAGAGASAATLAALVVLSRLEGGSPARAINASGHVLWGPGAARAEASLCRTLAGLAINVGAAHFWGAAYAAFVSRSPRPSARRVIAGAGLTALAATIVDYGLVPRRLTPGWELALSSRSVAATFAAMAAGLAAGGLRAVSR